MTGAVSAMSINIIRNGGADMEGCALPFDPRCLSSPVPNRPGVSCAPTSHMELLLLQTRREKHGDDRHAVPNLALNNHLQYVFKGEDSYL